MEAECSCESGTMWRCALERADAGRSSTSCCEKKVRGWSNGTIVQARGILMMSWTFAHWAMAATVWNPGVSPESRMTEVISEIQKYLETFDPPRDHSAQAAKF